MNPNKLFSSLRVINRVESMFRRMGSQLARTKKIFSPIGNFLKKLRFFHILLLIAVIALSVWVWFKGPVWVIGDKLPLTNALVRQLVILTLLVLWFLTTFVGRKTLDKAEEKTDEAEQLRIALEKLSARFSQAFEIIRYGILARGGSYKTQQALPIFMVLGDSAAGKSELVRHSGIDLPLVHQSHDCCQADLETGVHFAFGQKAIFIEADARYVNYQPSNQPSDDQSVDTQPTGLGSKKANNTLWQTMLKQLKYGRKNEPLNGVLIALNLKQLLQMSQETLTAYTQALRGRIDQINEALNIHCPVYVTLTGIDHLTGFTDYFQGLDKEDRNQPWGFAIDKGSAVDEAVSTQFDALIQRLNQRVLKQISTHDQPLHSGGAFNFPQQLAQVKNRLTTFVHVLSLAHQYHQNVYLRGIYFTSALQKEVPENYLLTPIAGLLKQAPYYAPRSQSFFLKDLFHDIILPDAKTIIPSHKRIRYDKTKHQIKLVAVAFIASVALLTLTQSFLSNRSIFMQIKTKVKQFEEQMTTVEVQSKNEWRWSDTLALLDQLNHIHQLFILHNKKGAWVTGLLVNNNSVLRDAINTLYLEKLHRHFVPFVQATLEKTLEEQIKASDKAGGGSSNQLSDLYNSLEAYIMLADPKRMNATFVSNWVGVLWQRKHYDAAANYSLKANLDSLLSLPFLPIKENANLVKEARNHLAELAPAERIYYRLKGLVLGKESQQVGFAASYNESFVKTFGQNATAIQVPEFFTPKGYATLFEKYIHQTVQNVESSNWVLGKHFIDQPIAEAPLILQVKALYMADYIHHWQQALSMLKVLPINSFTDVNLMTQLLAQQNDSAIVQVLKTLKNNTDSPQLPTVRAAFSSLNALTTDAQGNQPIGLGKLEKASKKASSAGKESAPAKIADSHQQGLGGLAKTFSALHDYLAKISTSESVNQASFDAATVRMQAVNIAADKSKTAQGGAADKTQDDPILQLRKQASNLPKPLSMWLDSIAAQSWKLLLTHANQTINQAWQQQVLPQYQRLISGRYPFDLHGKQSMTINDLTQFFSPKTGVYAKFFAQYLQPFIKEKLVGWQLNKLEGQGLPITQATVEQLHKAYFIQHDLFDEKTKQFGLSFNLKPVSLDSTIATVELIIDSNHLTYQHGPRFNTAIQWPAQNSGNQSAEPLVQIQFHPLNGSVVTQTYKGLWGWLRLLDQAKIEATNSPGELLVTFTLNGYKAQYLLSASGLENPFLPSLWHGLNLPSNI